MQQKYSDQGRSRALSTMTCPTCRARSSCGWGGKPKKGVGLAVYEKLHRLDRRGGDDAVDILFWVEPDLSGDQNDE